MHDFSLAAYSTMLSAFLQAGYQFRKFVSNATQSSDEPYILLRHDIDFSLDYALAVATLEHNLGIVSTFFVLLHSPIYNALSKRSLEALAAIHQQGHDIALHYDLGFVGRQVLQDRPALHESIAQELQLLSIACPFICTQVISFHRPRRHRLNPSEIQLPAGISHTYDSRYTAAIAYFSDSLSRWGNGHPLDSETFARRLPMQLLTHPIWWIEPGQGPEEKIASYLGKQRNWLINALEETTVSLSLAGLREGASI